METVLRGVTRCPNRHSIKIWSQDDKNGGRRGDDTDLWRVLVNRRAVTVKVQVSRGRTTALGGRTR